MVVWLVVQWVEQLVVRRAATLVDSLVANLVAMWAPQMVEKSEMMMVVTWVDLTVAMMV